MFTLVENKIFVEKKFYFEFKAVENFVLSRAQSINYNGPGPLPTF